MSLLPSDGGVGPIFEFTSLKRQDRQNIVLRSGNQQSTSAFLEANEFRLSALGTDMDILGEFPYDPSNSFQGWRHITSSGRDQHVKVVYSGYLFPLGHHATITTVTDRVLSPDPVFPGSMADAYLQNYTFIRVTQRSKSYPALGQPYGNQTWPFSDVTFITEVTPDLDDEVDATSALPNLVANVPTYTGHPQAFFPQVGGNNFLFAIKLTDLAGNVVTTQVPLAFVYGRAAPPPGGTTAYPLNQFNGDAADMGALNKVYNPLGQVGGGPLNYVQAPVPGTRVRYAPEVIAKGTTPKPGATTHPTLALTLGAAGPINVPSPNMSPAPTDPDYIPPYGTPATIAQLTNANQPAFYPTLLSANIRLPAAETMSRAHFDDGTGPGGVQIFMFGQYVTDGFTKPSGHAIVRVHPNGFIDPSSSTNPGSVYAGLLNQPGLNFPSDAIGALGNPNLNVQGLSAAAGAIGGTLSQYATKAEALISEYFGALTSSQLLGGLTLQDILGAFSSLGGDDLGVPELTHQVAADGTITVSYTLKAKLQNALGVFTPDPSYGQMFTLTATVTVSLSGKTTLAVNGTIDPFKIEILGGSPIISIPFGSGGGATPPGATFTAGTGKKTDIKVNVGQPSFEGALSFVNDLEQFLSDIGGSGISINVSPTQISASISLDLPSIGCGMFNLENMALSAAVVIPFLGDPATATFGFCSQEKPFSLTVMCFGGGGYVLVGVGLTSLQSLTASLDFEGQLGLDLGVASGSVSAMAGITFSYKAGSGSVLTGFVKIVGEVEILGIISVSLELDLQLSYASATNVATGTATMKISVSLCFFSISVPITVQKSFNGGTHMAPAAIVRGAGPRSAFDNNADTTFGAQMDTTSWLDYCSAFAS